MDWKIFVPWLLFGVTVIGILIYIIYTIRNRPKGLSELKAEIKRLETENKEYRLKVIEDGVKLKNAEKEKAKLELDSLEKENQETLAKLSEEKKREFEKAKKDPRSGIDYINSLLSG